jgi:hypothetical protein
VVNFYRIHGEWIGGRLRQSIDQGGDGHGTFPSTGARFEFAHYYERIRHTGALARCAFMTATSLNRSVCFLSYDSEVPLSFGTSVALL